MKKIIITSALFLGVLNSFGQTNVLQDKSGAGTLNVGANQLSFNAGDASVTANIGALTSLGTKTTFWDANIKFKSTDGAASILDGNKLKPTIDIGGDYGWGSNLHKYYIAAKLSTSFFNILKIDNTNTFTNRSFIGPSVSFGYNLIGQTTAAKPAGFLLGLSASVGMINNLSDLKPVDVYQSVTVTAHDTSLTLLKSKKSGFSGGYHTSAAVKLNMDAFVFPGFLNNQVGVGGYTRFQFFGYQPRQNVGLGVITGQKGAPANIAFGLLYQFNDVFNQLGAENNFLKRGGINLVAGYKF